MMKGGVLVVLGFLFLGSMLPAVSCQTVQPASVPMGVTWYVGGDGPGNFTTIQDAVNASVDGDIVYVYRHEPYYWENVVITKAISLVSDCHAVSLLARNYQLPAIRILHDAVRVDGFLIHYEGGFNTTGYAIIVENASNVNISNCDFKTDQWTITFDNVSSSSIFHNLFETIESYDGGILVSGGHGNIIERNHINIHFGNDAVITNGARNTTVIYNNFSFPCDFDYGWAIEFPGAGSGNKIIDNNFFTPARSGTRSYWNGNYYGGARGRQHYPFLHHFPMFIPSPKLLIGQFSIDWHPASHPNDLW